jgi:hypothetical protein
MKQTNVYKCFKSILCYIIKTVYLQHVLATLVAILREMHIKDIYKRFWPNTQISLMHGHGLFKTVHVRLHCYKIKKKATLLLHVTPYLYLLHPKSNHISNAVIGSNSNLPLQTRTCAKFWSYTWQNSILPLNDKWQNYVPPNAHPFHLDVKTLFCSENI